MSAPQNVQITTEQLLQTIGQYGIGSRVMQATIQQQAQQIDALTKELDAIKKAEDDAKKPHLVEKAQ